MKLVALLGSAAAAQATGSDVSSNSGVECAIDAARENDLVTAVVNLSSDHDVTVSYALETQMVSSDGASTTTQSSDQTLAAGQMIEASQVTMRVASGGRMEMRLDVFDLDGQLLCETSRTVYGP